MRVKQLKVKSKKERREKEGEKMAKGYRQDYSFFRVFILYGTESVSIDELWFVGGFVRKYGCDPESIFRRHDVKGAYVNKFVDLLDAVEDEKPELLCQYDVELRDPIGRVIRRWSTTRTWRKGSNYFIHQNKEG